MVAPKPKSYRPTGSPSSQRLPFFDKYNSAERMVASTSALRVPTKVATPTTPTSTPATTSRPIKSPRQKKGAVSNFDAKKPSFAELQNNLQRYARGNDRRMALRALTECKGLRSIPMDGSPSSPSSNEEFKNLEREVCFTSIELNGLLFPAKASNQILKILSELCNELCRESRLSFQSIYQAMIVRLARTTSSADSYFHLNALLGSQDLVLQARQAPTPPTHLTMYESDGSIHAVLTTYHAYGLFRRCDVTSGKAWIPLLASIHERVNFRTGDCFRTVNVKTVQDS